MKRASTYFYTFITTVILSACGSYKYYNPTPIATLPEEQGEIMIQGDIGSSGASVKSSYTLSHNLSLNFQYNSGISNYESNDFEFGVGYFEKEGNFGYHGIVGLGVGNNLEYTDSTKSRIDYKGKYARPFVQGNMGLGNLKLFSTIRSDLIFLFRINYFVYTGSYQDDRVNKNLTANYFLYEPGFSIGLGGNIFKMNLSFYVPMRITAYARNNSVRTFPFSTALGLNFYFNRKTYD